MLLIGMSDDDLLWTCSQATVLKAPAHTFATPLEYVLDVLLPTSRVTFPYYDGIPSGYKRVWKVQDQQDPPNVLYAWDDDGAGGHSEFFDAGNLWVRLTTRFTGAEWRQEPMLVNGDGDALDAFYSTEPV